MGEKRSTTEPSEIEETASDRRKFLGTLAAGAGAATLLAGLGAGPVASAQQGGSTRQGGSARPGGEPAGRAPGFPPRPPEPKFSQPPPLKDVAGKTVYVTAASDGIGLGIARACSNAGMNVVIGYRNEKRLEAALPLFKKGAPVFPVKHDVVGRDGWVQMLNAVKGKYGKLHAVVNNAGIKTLRPASEATPEEWQNSFNVDLMAISHSVAVVLPHMKEHNEGGQFVATSSMSGLLPAVTAGIYTTMKFAVVGIMEALRIELERTNIGTSVFCPGGVATDNYFGTGKDNPYLEELRRERPRPNVAGGRRRPNFNPNVMMHPLEAGERVLNGIRNNDLFILSHPEFKDGMEERFNAILTSVPDEAFPPERLVLESITRHTGIYPREIVHRLEKRESYLG
ncbi:MAG TPA: SDR family NAD(P)-dependent oxidoreductase [Steroidobacteraceae bacterium]|nr:SDR family NAD(P)-dependent oxidoreductase [Steroidobacteraceae bacterium]